jgi:filamentous hemagglutinin
VREIAAKENARLTAECEPNCTAEDFQRIDQQAAAVERAVNLAEVAKRGVITPDQAQQLAQTLLELTPVYGSGESALQLITGRSSLTGEEANRIWAAVGLVPLAGGMVRKVGEPVVETLTSVLRALDGPVFKTTREAAQAAQALGFRRINETVNGQAVFTDGKNYISRDVDGHNGGAWKAADSVKELGTKETRAGTWNSDLTKRIGD